MDKNGRSIFWQDKIWFAREVTYVYAKAQAACMQSFPNDHLRCGILAFNFGHHARSGLGINYINQNKPHSGCSAP